MASAVSSDSHHPKMSSSPPEFQMGSGCIGGMKSLLLYEPIPGQSPPNVLFFKHRYFRAFAFLMMCLVNTLVYYGWQPFSMMLFRSGAYAWHCTPEELADLAEYEYCQEQGNRVKALFNIGLCAEFVMGVFSGVSLDHIGPWFTGLVGSCSFFLGWMLLLYSSESFVAYIPGMIFLAGAVNFIAFPCLCLGDLFPSRAGFAISLVVAAQTTGTIVAPVMKLAWDNNPQWTFGTIVWGYLGFFFFPITFIYLLAVPWKRLVVNGPVKTRSLMAEEPIKDISSISEIELKQTAGTAVQEGVKNTKSEPPLDIVVTDEVREVGISRSTIHTPTFLHQVTSIDYIFFTIYYVLQVLQYGFYPNTVQDQFGQSVANVQGYILPTQGVFGAIFGLVVDKTKTLPICILLVVMMTLAYGFALIPNTALQYFTSLLYVISNSYIYTVKYTYVAEMYPPIHFGVLIGLMGCIAGALGLVNIPIQNANAYVITCIAYIGVGLVALGIVIWLWMRQRSGIHYRSLALRLTSKDESNVEASDDTKPEIQSL